MASGDFTPKEWLQKALTNTGSDSKIDGASGKRRYVTSITAVLQVGVTTAREVQIFKNGTATNNLIGRITIDPTDSLGKMLGELPWFLENGQSLYIKQDTTNNDVNILVTGLEEEI